MLSRSAILEAMERGLIEVNPPPKNIGVNSIDLTLGDRLQIYPDLCFDPTQVLDPRVRQRTQGLVLTKQPGGTLGWLLEPGRLYLGTTAEETFCKGLVPVLEGRSSTGRLGIKVHLTAGFGDNGFRGQWTLEIEVMYPTILRPGDRICQVHFQPCYKDLAMTQLELDDLYGAHSRSHYAEGNAARGAEPLD